MGIRSDAWVLHEGKPGAVERAVLVREVFEFPDITSDEVLAEPLYGGWEGNMGHALDRKPIDICHFRQEKSVVLGNSGIVRVVRTGSDVTTVKPGDLALLFPAFKLDRYGYPEKIHGYDAAGTVGVLAKTMKTSGHALIPIPPNSKYSATQWASFSGRYITAWSNWELAFGTLRLQLDQDELPHPHVWAWGGGTALAELELANRFGCRTVMLSGDDRRLAEIARRGVTAVDRRTLGDLTFDELRFGTDLAYRRRYSQAESAFLKEVMTRTDGEGVHIFVDHIGTAVFRVTLKALSRQGVVATAGWKAGQVIMFLRAMECILRHQHVHTHYARYRQGVAAVRYAEEHGWMPDAPQVIHSFEDIPQLAEDYSRGDHELFPMFSINPE